ncbi:MAG: pyrimidine dimer DNA glycosylase/endonuclease V [Rikenellaceae bacterium]|nr:pyrimidine dimer DNA glycosylase/endonuclease V [Rikenellaceae bacterium]
MVAPPVLPRPGRAHSLLARKVLEGNTVGYRNHPQLTRFRESGQPLAAIDAYLHAVCDEALRRGYTFDRGKLGLVREVPPITVTTGQILFETGHLLSKLSARDAELYGRLCNLGADEWRLHPLFTAVEGPVERWEIIR